MTIAQILHRDNLKIIPACIDFLFPPQCCYCRCAMKATSNDSSFSLQKLSQPSLCEACSEKLPPPANNSCLKCGAVLGPYASSEQGCVYCRKNKFAFTAATSLALYENDFREMCLLCKKNPGQPLAWFLANRLWETEQDLLNSWQCDCIVHVPMHWTNRLLRHVHPVESIADCLSKQLKIPHLYRAIKQSRQVARQSHLSPSKRRENVQNIFRTSRFYNLKDRTILLVDDVLTTGTTANECAKVLKKAGAKQVYVAVLARGIGK